VNTLAENLEGKSTYPGIGTGTLLDEGNPLLKGRCVITCTHCCWDLLEQMISDNRIPRIDNNGDGADIVRIYCLEVESPLFAEGHTSVSITPEIEQTTSTLPLLNTLDDFNAALDSKSAYAIECMYFFTFTSNGSRFQIGEDGKPLFKRKIIEESLDFCMVVLKESVQFKNRIIPGVPLDKLKVVNIEKDPTGWHVLNVGPENLLTVVGYGLTGIPQIDPVIDQTIEQAIENGKLSERQHLLSLLGWNTKKSHLFEWFGYNRLLSGMWMSKY
jgi:hypothetical protein